MRFDFRIMNLFSDQRMLAFDVNLDATSFNICCITEIWTCDDAEHFMTPSTFEVFLSGSASDSRKGLGIIIISKKNDY